MLRHFQPVSDFTLAANRSCPEQMWQGPKFWTSIIWIDLSLPAVETKFNLTKEGGHHWKSYLQNGITPSSFSTSAAVIFLELQRGSIKITPK